MPPRRSRYSRHIKKTKSKAKSRRSTGRSRRSRFSGGCWLSDLFKSKKSNNGSNAANKSKANNNAAMRRSGNISVPLEEVQNYTQLNSITKSIQNSKPAWLQNLNSKKNANKVKANKNSAMRQSVSLEEVQNNSQLKSIANSIEKSKQAWNSKKNVANNKTYRNKKVEQNVGLINPTKTPWPFTPSPWR